MSADYAQDRVAGSVRAPDRPFSIITVQHDTRQRLADVRSRFEILAARILGALPPPKGGPENPTNAVAADNLTNRFRECDIAMNREIDRMDNFITALEDQL